VIDFNDKKTWELFKDGKTKGIFQLESNLGRSWSKKLAPDNIEHLSALIAILRPGCVSGDTLVHVGYDQHKDGRTRYRRTKLSQLCKNKKYYKKLSSLNENQLSVYQNNIEDIFYNGKKECYKVKIEKYSRVRVDSHPKWYDLECTLDHKLLTPNGWVELQNLNVGDRIAVVKRTYERKLKEFIANRHHPEAPKIRNVKGSYYFSEICYKNYLKECVICGWNSTTLDVHHLNGGRYENNTPDNLAYLCPNHHRELDKGLITNEHIILCREKNKLPQSNDIEWVTYIGKESVGIKDVYDISMTGPNHNFVAGGFIVHNCLKSVIDGKSLTQHYVDRKNGKEEVTYIHESLRPILEKTYGILCYQEQAMQIVQQLAGFNLTEADDLRKAIGKKKADLMTKIKSKFIEGCKKTGIVDEETAKEIFGWIEKSSRYSFNKSHSVSYAVNSYISAWYKAHFTKEFFLSYLYHANDKQDPHQEIYELVSEAKLFDIEIKIPKIGLNIEKFSIIDQNIYFGIKDIKSLSGVIGDKVLQSIEETEKELNKRSNFFSWIEILIYLSSKINSASFKALCCIGFFSNKQTLVSRNRALYEYLIFEQLTKSELTWVINNYPEKRWESLIDCLADLAPTKKEGGGTSRVDRSQLIKNEIHFLQNPPYSLEDQSSWIIDQEKKFLGCPISLSKVEAIDTSSANTTCKEIMNGKTGKNICIVANINRVASCKVKKGKTAGKTMSFLTLEDETCFIDNAVVFPEVRDKYEFILYEGNNLLFCGEVSKKDNSFIIEKIHEI